MTPCPSPAVLARFVRGRLTAAAETTIEAHIDECETCRHGLAALVRDPDRRRSLGRYRIDDLLGAGGMGIVYRGFDPMLSRPVAIKVVRRGDDVDADALRARLGREAAALAQLNHRHVCQVYDVGVDDDEVWLAMELVDGGSLRTWIALAPARSEILRVLGEVADGLAAAHAVGLCHRDVKPDNVLISPTGRAVVTDFGLARSFDDASRTTAVAGTLAYLAPELLDGAKPDARSDQYAFAVMAHEALHGARPGPHGLVATGLPAGLRRILTRALAGDPAQRFPSMTALAARLQAFATRPRHASGIAVAATLALGGAVTVVAFVGTGDQASPMRSHTGIAATTSDARPPDPAPPDALARIDATIDPRALHGGSPPRRIAAVERLAAAGGPPPSDGGTTPSVIDAARTDEASTDTRRPSDTALLRTDASFGGDCAMAFDACAVELQANNTIMIFCRGHPSSTLELSLKTTSGTIALSTAERLAHEDVVSLVMSKRSWENFDRAKVDPVSGAIKVRAFHPNLGILDVTFEHAVLSDGHGSLCTIDGRVETFRLGTSSTW